MLVNRGVQEEVLAKDLKPRTASVMILGSGLPGILPINVSNERIEDFCENSFHFLLLTEISGFEKYFVDSKGYDNS